MQRAVNPLDERRRAEHKYKKRLLLVADLLVALIVPPAKELL